MLMKLFRIGIIVAFIGSFLLFCRYYYNANFNIDKTIPEIVIDSESLEIPLSATDADILQGVSAYDEKDGDLTDKVMVESISKFTTKGVSVVTYAVCDKDNHVTTATRKITYHDYKSPVFSMSNSFCFSVRSVPQIKGIVGATDCIDGDISGNVIITSADYKANTEGYYHSTIKVTNSKGDTSSLDIPIIVEDRSTNAPIISLKQYLIYVKKGQIVDFSSYVDSVTDVYDTPLEITPEINADYNTTVPAGVYQVNYYATDEGGRTGHTILIIVVEDK